MTLQIHFINSRGISLHNLKSTKNFKLITKIIVKKKKTTKKKNIFLTINQR